MKALLELCTHGRDLGKLANLARQFFASFFYFSFAIFLFADFQLPVFFVLFVYQLFFWLIFISHFFCSPVFLAVFYFLFFCCFFFLICSQPGLTDFLLFIVMCFCRQMFVTDFEHFCWGFYCQFFVLALFASLLPVFFYLSLHFFLPYLAIEARQFFTSLFFLVCRFFVVKNRLASFLPIIFIILANFLRTLYAGRTLKTSE